jgi:hypothetical protein
MDSVKNLLPDAVVEKIEQKTGELQNQIAEKTSIIANDAADEILKKLPNENKLNEKSSLNGGKLKKAAKLLKKASKKLSLKVKGGALKQKVKSAKKKLLKASAKALKASKKLGGSKKASKKASRKASKKASKKASRK